MSPNSSGSTRAQRQNAIQARILKNRNLLGQPQPGSEPPESITPDSITPESKP